MVLTHFNTWKTLCITMPKYLQSGKYSLSYNTDGAERQSSDLCGFMFHLETYSTDNILGENKIVNY